MNGDPHYPPGVADSDIERHFGGSDYADCGQCGESYEAVDLNAAGWCSFCEGDRERFEALAEGAV